MIMASLRAQQRYSTGRIKKRAINPREITLKSCHRKSNKLGRAKRGLTKKILWWEIGKRSRKRKQDKEMHACHGTDRLRLMLPWLVPPWVTEMGVRKGMALEKIQRWEIARKNRNKGLHRETCDRLLDMAPWMVPPWITVSNKNMKGTWWTTG